MQTAIQRAVENRPLADHGRERRRLSPSDLQQHDCIVYRDWGRDDV
jgi:hypothetical protein